jgi:hypothetical protein
MTRAFAAVLGLSLVCSFAACNVDSSDGVSPPGDSTYSAGPFTVDPGKELVMCTYVKGTNDADADIVKFTTNQSKGCHHLIVYTVDHPVDLPPYQCSQGGQPGWNQLLATQVQTEEISFPAGVGFHVKAHQQYVIETHYINSTSEPLNVQSSFTTTLADPGSVTQRASTYFFGTMNIDLAPNAQGSSMVTCKLPEAMGIHTMFGHEHRMGTGVDVTHINAAGDRTSLYSTTVWDGPPIQSFDGGLNLTDTDSIEVKCQWDNTGTDVLRYPHEMCFAIGYYWPADDSLFCTSGGQKSDCTCRHQGALDTGPGGSTVEVHLNRADTITGSKGDLDKGAPIYCALFRKEDWNGLLPKDGAEPYYFRDAVDQPLPTSSDMLTIDIQDVTPGDYVVTCLMDSIGGGFETGTGDVVNITAPAVTAVDGQTVETNVTLDFAIP